uniref:Uncharacterized protein n=1 Tax=Rhizophora mucronata TaxID=61149 RepID=A0A2P2PJI4_RHIMU
MRSSESCFTSFVCAQRYRKMDRCPEREKVGCCQACGDCI